MIKNSSKQTGSAHVIIVVILIVALLGALGFVFWNNFMMTKTSNTSQSDKPPETKSPKSGVVVLASGDMNKYINYEKKFEFMFPKQIYTSRDCQSFDYRFDSHGNKIPSESHYGVASGTAPMTVLVSNNDYIVTSAKTTILSDPTKIPEYGNLFKACNIVDTTPSLIDEAKKSSSEVRNLSVEYRSFRVEDAANKEAALDIARSLFKDPTGTMSWGKDAANDKRENGEFVYTPNPDRVGGFAYKLWYYGSQKKLVYIALGQSVSFEHPDHSDKYYIDDVVNSFKFN